MQVTAHHPKDREPLRQYSHRQRKGTQRDRYRAVALALESREAPAIAQTLVRSRRFVRRWVYQNRDYGLSALGPKQRSGRPSRSRHGAEGGPSE